VKLELWLELLWLEPELALWLELELELWLMLWLELELELALWLEPPEPFECHSFTDDTS